MQPNDHSRFYLFSKVNRTDSLETKMSYRRHFLHAHVVDVRAKTLGIKFAEFNLFSGIEHFCDFFYSAPTILSKQVIVC